MKQDLLSGLTEEQIARIKECKSQEEILAFAKEQGIELNDEQLDAVSGGGCLSSDKCPYCGSDNYSSFSTGCVTYCKCLECGGSFQIH